MHFTPSRYMLILALFAVVQSCKTANKIFTSKKTPHEQYGSRLTDARLESTALGTAWFVTARSALQNAVKINLPYRETGFFAAERPSASGYLFAARHGEKLTIEISTDTLQSFLIFADLYKADSINPIYLTSADTTQFKIEYEIKQDGNYQLRLQPELLKSGRYSVVISATGSLAFPVPAQNNPKIESFWGASRDNGARKHEGIDIFGKFRTPVVAAADGYITSTQGNSLGGKVVFLRPSNRDFTLYYAHLDSQMVRQGQEVKTGDVVGLMGNTGNARTTPTHLHFGIYANGGAIDPLPFVDKSDNRPEEIVAPLELLGTFGKTSTSARFFSSPSVKSTLVQKVQAGITVRITAATADWYKIFLPDGKEAFVTSRSINAANTIIRTITPKQNTVLLDDALAGSAPKQQILAGVELPVYGSYGDFDLVESDGLTGWIRKEKPL